MGPTSFRGPVSLIGTHVDLVPLELSHAAPLLHAGRDPEVSRFLASPVGPSLTDLSKFISELRSRAADGTDLPFTAIRHGDRTPIGMSRYLHIDRENRSAEIGGTWFDSACWRTPVNTEAKYLMLRHAFEVETAHRVWLQTDLRNDRSQRAIERLGASREGVLREDRLLPSGRFRSSVVYSIVADEWPRVRGRLEEFLQRPWTDAGAEIGSPPRG